MTQRPLRIAYVCADRGIPIPGQSGSAVHVVEMVRALRRRGLEVTLLAANVTGPYDSSLEIVDLGADALLEDVRARIGKALRTSGRDPSYGSEAGALLLNQCLAQALERRDFDLVYERQSLWSLAGLQLARARGLPYFLEVNAPLIDQQSEYRVLQLTEAARAIEGALFASADRVFVTTPALLDYVHGGDGARRRMRVLPCGVSESFFAAGSARKDAIAGTREVVLGFVGSLKPWHGIEILLEAFARLHERSTAYRLLVVGDGPLRALIEEFRNKRGLEPVIELVGSVPHEGVRECLRRIDIGLAPYPPLAPFYFSPLKVWEYAAAGVPIVASASGELPSQFPHKRAAMLHTPGNVEKLVAHVERLRAQPELAQRLARRARRTARMHTWDRIAARLERAIRRSVGPRSST